MKNFLFALFLSGVIAVPNLSAQRFGNTPEDSVECLKNISLYTEFYKQKNYADAFEPWLWLYYNCPQNHVNTFIRGNMILKQLIIAEKDFAARDTLIDLLLSSWDKRAEVFGRPDICKGRKAMDILQVRPRQIDTAYQLLNEAVNEGAETEYIIVFYLFEAAMRNEKAGNMTKEDVIEVYDRVSTIFERLIQNDPADTVMANTYANVDIAFEPYATCEELIPIFEKRFETNKTDEKFLSKVCRVLTHKKCTESELFFKATEALYAIRPDVKTAFLMATMCEAKKNYAKIIEYLAPNASQLDNDKDKVRAYLMLSRAYAEQSKYTEGRDAARKVIEITPNDGRAYIMIGDLYARSARACGDDAEVSQRAAYWAAVDKFRQAKSLDPSIAEIADKYISTYAAQFPSAEDLFFRGITEGSSYKVGCWIQESTVVRKR